MDQSNNVPGDAVLLRRVQRSAHWQSVRLWLAVFLVVVLLPLILIAGNAASDDDQRLIDRQPHQRTPVVDVQAPSPLLRAEGPTVTVLMDGRTVPITNSSPGDEDIEVGDQIVMVQDPRDPTYVIAANSHDGWEYTALGGLVIWAGIGGGALFLTLRGIAPWPALRVVRRCTQVKQATVEQIDGRRVILVSDHGARLSIRLRAAELPEATAQIFVVGDFRIGGWAVLGISPRDLYWPSSRFCSARS